MAMYAERLDGAVSSSTTFDVEPQRTRKSMADQFARYAFQTSRDNREDCNDDDDDDGFHRRGLSGRLNRLRLPSEVVLSLSS